MDQEEAAEKSNEEEEFENDKYCTESA